MNADQMDRCGEMRAALLEERPGFHGWDRPGSENYALSDEVLRWLVDHLPVAGASLETGCGYSTILFAVRSRVHTAISLFKHEHDLIRHWGAKHDLSMDPVIWIEGRSQEYLPQMNMKSPLDVILIDGDHAFPAPFMDWYYTADRLRSGGYLLVDDIQLATGRVLMEFLEAERERWRRLAVIDKTVIFQRIGTGAAARGVFWTAQPWVEGARIHGK